MEECKKNFVITATDLAFTTRFVAVFMFVKVKGCRPMTYQHLTVTMFENAKTNGGPNDLQDQGPRSNFWIEGAEC